MPKRSLDIPVGTQPSGPDPPAKVLKTERSHEENQERAYIAASRRADRSLEARVQSAKMASDIHRRRTGRGLKVTEEIVIKEEMYEEEEDDLPRQYKYLTAHLQTNSPAMNSRVNAFITTQTAMATMARYNEVNRLFCESFPSATGYRQQLQQSVYSPPFNATGNAQYSPTSPTQTAPALSPSTSVDAHFGNMNRRVSTATTATTITTATNDTVSSPTSGTTESMESRGTPCQTQAQAQTFTALDPPLQHPKSSFTSEVPNEVKMMANFDPNDPMVPYFYGGNQAAYQAFGRHLDQSTKSEPVHDAFDFTSAHEESGEQYEDVLYSPAEPYDGLSGSLSRLGTPGAGMTEGAWDSFVDFGSEQ